MSYFKASFDFMVTILIIFKSKCIVIFIMYDVPHTDYTKPPSLCTPNKDIINGFFFSFLLCFIVFRRLTPCFSNKNARFSAVLVANLRYLLAFLPLFSKGSRFVRNLTYFLFELFRYGPLIEKNLYMFA